LAGKPRAMCGAGGELQGGRRHGSDADPISGQGKGLAVGRSVLPTKIVTCPLPSQL
jgi:hypothetical protein